MKKFYEAPVVEVAMLETKEDILTSSTDVEINVGGLFSIVDAGEEL